MIRPFKHKGLKLLYEKQDRSKLRPDIADKATRLLTLLDQAECPENVDLPGFGVHALKGDPKGFWSASVSRNYRIIFKFIDKNVCDVDLIDYR